MAPQSVFRLLSSGRRNELRSQIISKLMKMSRKGEKVRQGWEGMEGRVRPSDWPLVRRIIIQIFLYFYFIKTKLN
jgi:hypothetical protein